MKENVKKFAQMEPSKIKTKENVENVTINVTLVMLDLTKIV